MKEGLHFAIRNNRRVLESIRKATTLRIALALKADGNQLRLLRGSSLELRVTASMICPLVEIVCEVYNGASY